MTKEQFHRGRRMFLVHNRTVLVAPTGLEKSHVDWLADMFGMKIAQACIAKDVRGYVFNERLVAYTKFFSDLVDHRMVMLAIEVLRRVEPISYIGFGAIPTAQQPWEPRELYKFTDYINKIWKEKVDGR